VYSLNQEVPEHGETSQQHKKIVLGDKEDKNGPLHPRAAFSYIE